MIQDVIRNQTALQRLIEVCRSQRSIAVTGAGLSWWAGYRTWKELIDQLAERVRQRRGDHVNVDAILRDYKDRLLCAQVLAAELGPRGEFEDFSRFDAHVTEQELDLFQLAAGLVAQARACSAEIVWRDAGHRAF